MPIRLTDKYTTVYEGILHSRTLAFDYKVPTHCTAVRCDDNKPRLPTLDTRLSSRTCRQVKCNMAAEELNQAGSNEHTPRGCKWFSSPEEYKLRKQ